MALTFRHERDFFTGRPRAEAVITSDGVCDGPHWQWEWNDPADHSAGGRNTGQPAATLAHVGYEIVAQVLAAPIRKAFWTHFNLPHGDQDPARPWRAYCGECARLGALLPDGDHPVAIG